MKQNGRFVLLALFLITSLGQAQTDQATGTVTNDETQARLRVSNCVFGGPNVDVLVNGEVAINGGVPQGDQGFGTFGYLYLSPGTYSVAVVPTGKEIEEALLEPVDVSVEAGHRYAIAVLGQADEPSHTPLVIDETAAYQEIGARPTDNVGITINNLRGVKGIDWHNGGQVWQENVPYGGSKAAISPAGDGGGGFAITVSGAPDQVIDSAGGVPDPVIANAASVSGTGTDDLHCFGGTYPGQMGQNFDVQSSSPTSTLNTVDFLQLQSDVAARDTRNTNTFTTFLKAIEAADLSDLLTTNSPYMLFAPTDEAFEALPKEELDALMADSDALADLLRTHIAPGYYPPGTLGRGVIDRTATNLSGEELVLTGGGDQGLAINSVTMGSAPSTMVANGNRVLLVTKLLPPSQ